MTEQQIEIEVSRLDKDFHRAIHLYNLTSIKSTIYRQIVWPGPIFIMNEEYLYIFTYFKSKGNNK